MKKTIIMLTISILALSFYSIKATELEKKGGFYLLIKVNKGCKGFSGKLHFKNNANFPWNISVKNNIITFSSKNLVNATGQLFQLNSKGVYNYEELGIKKTKNQIDFPKYIDFSIFCGCKQ